MKDRLLDIFFFIGLLLMVIPIFRFNLDIGFFVSGFLMVLIVIKLSRKGGEDK